MQLAPQVYFSDFSSMPWQNLPPTWEIHMATRRPAHSTPDGLWAFSKQTIQDIHVDRRVVGWSAGCHVDHPCGWQISPWPARKVTEINLHALRTQKYLLGRKFWKHEKIPPKYRKNTQMGIFGILGVFFRGILGVTSGSPVFWPGGYFFQGCGLFACSWRLPAYSWSFFTYS